MISAIVVAAGKGVRMNDPVRKQYVILGGRPIIAHTLSAFDACESVDEIYLVLPEEDFDFCRSNILINAKITKKLRLVPGGSTRQESVYNGLCAANNANRIIVVHDGVRPFVRPEQINSCIAQADKFGACILGIPVYDTLKRVNHSGWIDNTLNRDTLWIAQTPQAFEFSIIKKAHENAIKTGQTATDDASLVEKIGCRVKIIKGSRYNIKITTKKDLKLANALLAWL